MQSMDNEAQSGRPFMANDGFVLEIDEKWCMISSLFFDFPKIQELLWNCYKFKPSEVTITRCQGC